MARNRDTGEPVQKISFLFFLGRKPYDQYIDTIELIIID